MPYNIYTLIFKTGAKAGGASSIEAISDNAAIDIAKDRLPQVYFDARLTRDGREVCTFKDRQPLEGPGDGKPRYLIVWGVGYESAPVPYQEVRASFFVNANGFDQNDICRIEGLDPGQCHNLDDGMNFASVVRLRD